MRIRIGVRPSRLALAQANEALDLIKKNAASVDINAEIKTVATYGDLDKTTPISDIEGSDFFTKEIEELLLNGKIDLAVHSAKDMEEDIPPGLVVAAVTASISPFECLVSGRGFTLDTLPFMSTIGTSSARRKGILGSLRSDLVIKDIRGDIEERLAQLDRGDFDAVIIAHAALIRLSLQGRISQIIPVDIMAPHPLQGALALQVRSSDKKLIEVISVLDKRGHKNYENKN